LEALKISGLKIEKEAIEAGLKTLIKMTRQSDIQGLKGELN